MADYDSDSSGNEDVATNVLLGYASKEPTGDDFSQLGGYPVWLDGKTAPPGTLAKCKVCNSLMSLLLQLNGDLPERFPGHERRIYIWACRRRACRRKEGSIRCFRATRIDRTKINASDAGNQASTDGSKPAVNIGETLFGVKSSSPHAQANPFAVPSHGAPAANQNPFASASSPAAKPTQTPATMESLPETFAQKARINATPHSDSSGPEPGGPQEPWPEVSSFPEPYPTYYVDADTEYLEPEPRSVPSNARLEQSSMNGEGSSSAAEDRAAFESSMDKTFQRFADRLAQNPEQVLRYEFTGQPLLYSKTDPIGILFISVEEDAESKVKVARNGSEDAHASRLPRCTNCGSPRIFELQLTPHAIAELEADDMSLEGMDWGTIIVCVCSTDCQQRGKGNGDVGYAEEWVGVQWEEVTGKRR